MEKNDFILYLQLQLKFHKCIQINSITSIQVSIIQFTNHRWPSGCVYWLRIRKTEFKTQLNFFFIFSFFKFVSTSFHIILLIFHKLTQFLLISNYKMRENKNKKWKKRLSFELIANKCYGTIADNATAQPYDVQQSLRKIPLNRRSTYYCVDLRST